MHAEKLNMLLHFEGEFGGNWAVKAVQNTRTACLNGAK